VLGVGYLGDSGTNLAPIKLAILPLMKKDGLRRKESHDDMDISEV